MPVGYLKWWGYIVCDLGRLPAGYSVLAEAGNKRVFGQNTGSKISPTVALQPLIVNCALSSEVKITLLHTMVPTDLQE